MKKIKRGMTSVQKINNTADNQTGSSNCFVTWQVVANLFAKWQARYLARWSGQFKGSPEERRALIKLAMNEWLDVLKSLSESEIKNGLARWREPWPPTADEFRRVCRPVGSLAHAETDRYLALPILKARPETRDAEMAKIRRMKNIRVGC